MISTASWTVLYILSKKKKKKKKKKLDNFYKNWAQIINVGFQDQLISWLFSLNMDIRF